MSKFVDYDIMSLKLKGGRFLEQLSKKDYLYKDVFYILINTRYACRRSISS